PRRPTTRHRPGQTTGPRRRQPAPTPPRQPTQLGHHPDPRRPPTTGQRLAHRTNLARPRNRPERPPHHRPRTHPPTHPPRPPRSPPRHPRRRTITRIDRDDPRTRLRPDHHRPAHRLR